jgi:hypothetical protein
MDPELEKDVKFLVGVVKWALIISGLISILSPIGLLLLGLLWSIRV